MFSIREVEEREEKEVVFSIEMGKGVFFIGLVQILIHSNKHRCILLQYDYKNNNNRYYQQ